MPTIEGRGCETMAAMVSPVSPTPAEVKAARLDAGMTQAEAALLVYLGSVTRWSEYERGVVKMDAARWELFRIRTGKSPYYRPARGVYVPKARKPRKAQS